MLYQTNPTEYLKAHPGRTSWTESLHLYWKSARKQAHLLRVNSRLAKAAYTWEAVIYFHGTMTPADLPAHQKLWSNVSEKLSKGGLIAFWVREPSKAGNIHYHFIGRSDQTPQQVRALIEAAMPKRAAVSWHLHVARIMKQEPTILYAVKAKIAGWSKGRWVPDKWAGKRLLFQKGIRLRKHGTVGRFWERSTKKLWAEVVAHERRIAAGLERPEIEKLVRYVYKEMFGETVCGRRIERAYGLHADADTVQRFAGQISDPN